MRVSRPPWLVRLDEVAQRLLPARKRRLLLSDVESAMRRQSHPQTLSIIAHAFIQVIAALRHVPKRDRDR